MPFSFYYMPYLVMTLEHYSPVEYYERMVKLCELAYSWKLLPARIAATPTRTMKAISVLRTFGGQGVVRRLRDTHERLKRDAQFRAFHEGRTPELPGYYRQLHASRLGPYAELLSADEMVPRLDPLPAVVAAPHAHDHAGAPATSPRVVAHSHAPATTPAAARAGAAD